MRLRDTHVAYMTLMNNCRGMVLEIVQRSESPNDAWQNLESHYKMKGTREILCLSHEVSGKTMQPGEDSFQFMMEIDGLAADLHRLGGRPVIELKKRAVIEAGLSADYKIEVCMLETTPTGLERAEIERVVGNQYNRLLRQQQNSKASPASDGTTTADRREKKRRLRSPVEDNCFNCGRNTHRAEDCKSAKKKI